MRGWPLISPCSSLFQYEHISALAEFVDAQANYYRHASEIMENLHKVLLEK